MHVTSGNDVCNGTSLEGLPELKVQLEIPRANITGQDL